MTTNHSKHLFTRMLKRNKTISIALIICILSTIYWLAIASDRYVSTAQIIIQRTDLSSGQSFNFSSLLGASSGANRSEQLLMREYLLSIDILKKLDKALHIRAHYSDPRWDRLSRLQQKDTSIEEFHQYYLSRVSIELDEYSGLLVIQSQAFDPQTAQAITNFLVHEGEIHMNQLAHDLAQNQVSFLETQVTEMYQQAQQARQAVLDFQNEKGLISPEATAENISAIIGSLQGQKAELETERQALEAYLVPSHPNVAKITQQIAAIDKQIEQEQAKLTAPDGNTLNLTVEEFQRLQLQAGFAQDIYKSALLALEKGRVEATRTIQKVSIIQTPTLPEYPLEPRRLYNATVFILLTFMLAGVIQLLIAIVKDHKD